MPTSPAPSEPARLAALSGTALRRLVALLAAVALIVALPVASAATARAEGTTDTATAAATATDAAEPSSAKLGSRKLRRGDTGADVVALQRLLKVKRTGVFDKRTRKAVRRIQRAAGLKANGVVNKRTLRAIKRASREQRAVRSLPRRKAPAASRTYAKKYIARKYGWGAAQHRCLVQMWERESNWRYWVSNPNGRYHGIPQTSRAVWTAAGYSTAQYMRNAEVQIKVGTRYIKGRYGTPCRAWAFWRSHHWY